MDTALIVAIFTLVISAGGLVITNLQWRRDLNVKLSRVREEVTIELIQQRIGPYSDLLPLLEPMSSSNAATMNADRRCAEPVLRALQNAIYGKVGLLASDDTRRILIYARYGCVEFMQNRLGYDELLRRVWLAHSAMRSDLGIIQRDWESEIERVRPLIEGEREIKAKHWKRPDKTTTPTRDR